MYIDYLLIIDKLDHMIGKHNNTYHKTIKMTPINVKTSIYSDFNVESNDRDAKFKIGDHVRISKYKNIFSKGCIPNWSVGVFVI